MQKILSAEIYKNSRILLGEDCNIKYNPESPYQVIIGKNGIGKSTFLTSLTSYPSLGGKVFHKDGYSSVKFETLNETTGQQSIVETMSTHGGKYSFTVDGEELNTGGTQSVQKDLFADVLGVTPVIDTILNPRFDFLAMSPQKRQEFLAKLTTGDLHFALALHKRLEQRSRQHAGTVKRLEANLSELRAKSISDDEYEGFCKRLEQTQQDIKDLYLELSADAENAVQFDIDDIMRRIDLIEEFVTKSWRKSYCWGGVEGGSEQGALDLQALYQEGIAANRARLATLTEQFDMFNEIHESLKVGNANDLDTRLNELNTLRDTLPPESALMDIVYPDEASYRAAIKELDSILGKISPMVALITGDWTEELLKTDLEALRAQCNSIQGKIYKITAEVEAIDNELNHKHKGEVRCPDCGKQFNPGLDEMRHKTLLKRKDELLDSRVRGEEMLAKQLALGTAAREMQHQYYGIMGGLGGFAAAEVVTYVESRTSLLESPQNWLKMYSDALLTLKARGMLSRIDEDIATINKQKAVLEANNLESASTIADKLAKLENSIWECTQQIEILTAKSNEHRARLQKVTNFNNVVEATTKEFEAVGEELLAYTESELNSIRNELLLALQASAADLSTLISNHDKDKTQIEYLEQLIVQERDCEIAAKKGADELSPKTGVIAEQLFGFIGAFLEDVMDVCNNIWTYNVEIYPAKDSGATLTYLFPVEFNNATNAISEDIAKTSEGQYALINFAIKLVALRYAGYNNGPLFLDEPEGKFEPVHKVKLMNFLRLLVEENIFSQVFVISHHESGWGALPNPDLVDFSNEHLGSNKHITFK